jgi:hypothetical protein
LVNRFPDLADGETVLKTRRCKDGLILAYVTFRGVPVDEAGQEALVAEISFTVTVTIDTVQQLPALLSYRIGFGHSPPEKKGFKGRPGFAPA